MTHDPSHPAYDPSATTKAPHGVSASAPVEVRDAEPWNAVASRLDGLADSDAQAALARCCGARRWVDAMLHARPFRDGMRLDRAIEHAFDTLEADDWLEAFAAHPRIGEKKERLAAFAHAEDSEREQAGVRGAHVATLAALSDGNRRYEEKFGHVFLVCATGKSADEMLAILRSRLANAPAAELSIAAGEQKKITRLRLAELR
jgi:OHCU decarboxylase